MKCVSPQRRRKIPLSRYSLKTARRNLPQRNISTSQSSDHYISELRPSQPGDLLFFNWVIPQIISSRVMSWQQIWLYSLQSLFSNVMGLRCPAENVKQKRLISDNVHNNCTLGLIFLTVVILSTWPATWSRIVGHV